jgi:serine/threonine protein phosphatase 1
MRYVIGDVHGCIDTLDQLIESLDLNKNDQLFFVGDLIDRGPGSRQVCDLVIKVSSKVMDVFVCKGNHEQLMIDSIRSEFDRDRWLRNGGEETLSSFGISSYDEMPEKYKSFFQQMRLFVETPGFLIVHAGFNFENDDIFSDSNAMIWTRDHRADMIKTGNRKIIHGHTPVPLEKTRTSVDHQDDDIDIDTGCVYADRPGFGYLIALRLEDLRLFYVKNCERSNGH